MLSKRPHKVQNKERKSTQNFHSLKAVVKDEMYEPNVNKANTKATESKTILDSFMYKVFFNGV